jgi:hypothetical protein
MRVRHEQLTEVTAMLDRTSNRNALATIVASMVVGSGIVITADSTLRPLGAIGFIAAAILAVWLAAGILWSRKY